MENNGLRFYQIFNFGGTIGVNGLSFGELIAANFISFIVMIILLGLLAALFPIIMLLAYGLLVLAGNWEQMQIDRIRVNILSMVGYVYFMIDYHYGFIGWRVLNTFAGSEFVDKFCYINTALFLFNIFLFLLGNNILNRIDLGIGRLGVFIGLLFFGYKLLVPVGSVLAPLITKQHVPKPVKENTKSIDDSYDGGSLEEDMEDFERGRGNYNYDTTPKPDEIIEDEGNYGC
jgi:hypothetical protein